MQLEQFYTAKGSYIVHSFVLHTLECDQWPLYWSNTIGLYIAKATNAQGQYLTDDFYLQRISIRDKLVISVLCNELHSLAMGQWRLVKCNEVKCNESNEMSQMQ